MGGTKLPLSGETIARSGKAVMSALSDQGFSENQKKQVLDKGFEDIAIEEGSRTEVRGTILKRSRILRNMAVAYFSDVSGSIACRGCGFVAENVYGAGARGLIEIHHLK
jgi:predicted HNH restriction endonuclease